jgi:hypothetical protein
MSKKTPSKVEQAISIIASHAYNTSVELQEGLPGGSCPEMGFDEELILEISTAFTSWQSRRNHIQDPYCVWFFDGVAWSKATKDMYQEDAYKAWYRLTSGGKKLSKPSFDSYYFLGRSNLMLSGRHEVTPDEDDFSIKYLLAKTFGD